MTSQKAGIRPRTLILSSNPERTEASLRRIRKLDVPSLSIWSPKGREVWERFENSCSYPISAFPKSVPDWMERLRAEAPDLILVTGLTKILPDGVLDFPKFGTFNLHAGRLPHYKGGSPLNWQILNGEEKIGVSLIRLVPGGIDIGPIVGESTFPLEDSDDILTVHQKANQHFGNLVHDFFSAFLNGAEICEKPQVVEGSGYWHQRSDEDGQIRWREMTAQQVRNSVRALTHPYPGAFSKSVKHGRVRFWKVELSSIFVRGTPGKVVFANGEGPFVVCKDSAVRVVEYTTETTAELASGDYFR